MKSQRNRLYRIWRVRGIVVLVTAASAFASMAGAQAPEPIALFDGTGMHHFYTFLKDRGKGSDPKQVFTVKDGLLRISGEEWGCITTHEEFENYHLVAEFKWGPQTWGDRAERARDSGILLHSNGPDGAYSGTWMHSIECQIIEGGTGDVLVVADNTGKEFTATVPVAAEKQGSSHVYDPDGVAATIVGGRINWWGRDPEWRDDKDFRGARDVERPVGEWNRLECIAVGRTITIILNGVVVNQCIDVQPRRGQIQVQSEGAEILFRSITLTPLGVNKP